MIPSFSKHRFVVAQKPVFDEVLIELQNGKKRTHWMWFIFPQVVGLGESDTSKYYSLKSQRQVASYLKHSLLGPRLIECTQTVNCHKDSSARSIFGWTDAAKFCSSMTLFNSICPNNRHFSEALDIFFDGRSDKATLQILENWQSRR